ncbi:MAG TPA: polysaccharide pyruvyl transferase family protein [Actinophytocola sp.]|uniref:polysaccharide pyruvyl transferase family protein n=1 Tax=Actinophytocola sp. TaxID=1872138 RepID=UPI002DBF1B3F|nr:polysaccharide pyruvyl transferase family protein [Actinophytocola sp.]HEU5469734.1 polysaccharide pyruvyl transferase family protein [Actinophytocola sp.]
MRTRNTGPTRVGLFGILGSGNLGNDGSLDAVINYLRERHPAVELDFMCMGPDRVSAQYGAPATHLQWYEARGEAIRWLPGPVAKIIGRLLDPARTLAWVRRQDVVIVPGMGVLEATVPLRPWSFPYSLYWLSRLARLTGTRVALVSVGADFISQRVTRWLVTRAARLAHYRSYRDAHSRNAMWEMGIDSAADDVYPDLAFALPAPPAPAAGTGTVGVGVMDYHGDNDERAHGDELHRAYLGKVKGFVRWLTDNGRAVRLFTGDKADEPVVREILADGPADRISAASVSSLDELMREMAAVDAVVATRYHNVLCALKTCRPTVSIGYAAKNDVLMASMGLHEFVQQARSLDLDTLIAQFTELERRSAQLQRILAERNLETRQRLERQFAALSAALFPAPAAVEVR